jgi:Ca2+-binding RTX toxin-like protein
MALRMHLFAIYGAAFAAVLLALGSSGPTAGETAGAARACRGQPATLVGAGELVGTPGRDVIVATVPGTLVLAGAGDDLVCGSRRAQGGPGDDEIHYSGPARLNDRFYVLGGTGDDVIAFHGEQLHASSGTHDGVHGGAGDDLMIGAGGMLLFSGGTGSDRLVAGPDGYLMDGGAGDDVLLGGGGQDILTGGGGDDRLHGRGRSDDLSGGGGRDEVWGGPAWDVCARGNEVEHACEADDWV